MARRLTREYRISQFISVHKDKYDYSLLPSSFGSHDKIKIICKIHGEFLQTSSNHLRGRGCSKCRIIELSKSYSEKFISKAKQIHGNNYDYSLVNYINNYTKIKLICNRCNNYFLQLPSSHLSGKGCPKCGILKYTHTTEKFIFKAKQVHGNNYDYSSVDYINSYVKIKLICNRCNNYFLQIPHNHLMGNGCPKCKVLIIYPKEHPLKIYLLEFKKLNKYYVGITTRNFYKRWDEHRKKALKGCKAVLHQAIRENKGSIRFKILEETTVEFAAEREAYYIDLYNSKFPNGFNVGYAGSGIFLES